MKISTPPKPIKSEFNLRKQKQVFDQVYLHTEDDALPSQVLKPEDYYDVHSREYVNGVLNGVLPNGFGDYDNDKLAHAVASVDSMYVAARAALDHRVAFAPVSGFHHAGYEHGGGFCTFNGLLIAAMKLRKANLLPEGLLIIDGDGHYGNGTEEIIAQLDLDWVAHWGLDYGTVDGDFDTASERLHWAMNSGKYSLIMYQAGADCHQADPAASGYLTTAQWDQRDRGIFRWAAAQGTPIVWNLAGGYNGNKTLTLHNRTFASALQVYEPESVRLHAALAGQ